MVWKSDSATVPACIKKQGDTVNASQGQKDWNTNYEVTCEPPAVGKLWPCGVLVARLPHTQEDSGSTPGRGSYLRQVSLH